MSRDSRARAGLITAVGRFQEQLSEIIEAISKVSELDLSDVPPTAHPLEIANTWAEDEPRRSARPTTHSRTRPTARQLLRVPPA